MNASTHTSTTPDTASVDPGLLATMCVEGTDSMHARYHSPLYGRFLSVDPMNSGKAAIPQSWNKYSYALNNPLKFVDPDGRTVIGFTGLRNREGGITGAIDGLVGNTALLGQIRHFRHQDVDQAVQLIMMRAASRNPGALLAIFGHSLGALASLETARALQFTPGAPRVDLLMTIDPAPNRTGNQIVPPNVDTAINFFQTGGDLGGEMLQAADPRRTTVHNIEVGIGHGGIDEAVMHSVIQYVNDQARTGDLDLERGLQFIQGVLVRVR